MLSIYKNEKHIQIRNGQHTQEAPPHIQCVNKNIKIQIWVQLRKAPFISALKEEIMCVAPYTLI